MLARKYYFVFSAIFAVLESHHSFLTSSLSTKQPLDTLQLRRRSPSVRGLPPPYMVHLYKQLKEDRLVSYGTANTIRSFFSFPGTLGGRDMLVFNVTSVHPSEYVERVDLHLQWKRQFPQPKKKTFRLNILKLDHEVSTELVTTIRRTSWASWQTLDVTDGIISCLDSDVEETRQHLVGLLLEDDENEQQEGDDISSATTIKALSNSFLIMFSEDDENLAIEGIQEKNNESNTLHSHLRFRDRRETLSNELPYSFLDDIEDESRAKSKHRLVEMTIDDTIKDNNEPKGSKLDANGRKRRKTRRFQLKLRKSWWKPTKSNENHQGDDSPDEQEQEFGEKNDSSCHRENLIVDFTKLGWNNWIIAPKKFNAYVCSGNCILPLGKTPHPSNYETLRGILAKQAASYTSSNAAGQLCCVPHILSYVPLLFYDENRNVVLKKFPDMKVESCICR